jgi:hypothetical protein
VPSLEDDVIVCPPDPAPEMPDSDPVGAPGRPRLADVIASPGSLVPFTTELTDPNAGFLWGDEWSLQSVTGEHLYLLADLFGSNPKVFPGATPVPEFSTSTEGRIRLPGDLPDGWYRVAALAESSGGRSWVVYQPIWIGTCP